jgi:hypothetical protein
MKLVIALFVLALLVTAAGFGVATRAGHAPQAGLHDTLRAIHYDTKYDLSAQRRMRAE